MGPLVGVRHVIRHESQRAAGPLLRRPCRGRGVAPFIEQFDDRTLVTGQKTGLPRAAALARSRVDRATVQHVPEKCHGLRQVRHADPGQPLGQRGIASGAGPGLRKVELPADGGRPWLKPPLGKDLGRFSFRSWQLSYTPSSTGKLTLLVRATANDGDMQPMEPTWNPGGYQRNCVESTILQVV